VSGKSRGRVAAVAFGGLVGLATALSVAAVQPHWSRLAGVSVAVWLCCVFWALGMKRRKWWRR
jgi:hypothetical protein